MDQGVHLLPRLTICLGILAGIVDTTGWLTLNGVFPAHVTGNLVILAADEVNGGAIRPAQALAVPVFVLVVGSIGLSVRLLALTPKQIQSGLLALQSVLLSCAALLALFSPEAQTGFDANTVIVAILAVAAMATQNALLHVSRQHAPTTAVMTGNIVVCTLALTAMLMDRGAARVAASEQWRLTWPLVIGFLAGCTVGSVSVFVAAHAAWLVAAIVSIAIAIWTAMSRVESGDRQTTSAF